MYIAVPGMRLRCKAHVFMPVAIFFGAERLTIQSNAHMAGLHIDEKESVNAELRNCLEALRRVQSVNNLAQHYLNLLRAMDLHKTLPLG